MPTLIFARITCLLTVKNTDGEKLFSAARDIQGAGREGDSYSDSGGIESDYSVSRSTPRFVCTLCKDQFSPAMHNPAHVLRYIADQCQAGLDFELKCHRGCPDSIYALEQRFRVSVLTTAKSDFAIGRVPFNGVLATVLQYGARLVVRHISIGTCGGSEQDIVDCVNTCLQTGYTELVCVANNSGCPYDVVAENVSGWNRNALSFDVDMLMAAAQSLIAAAEAETSREGKAQVQACVIVLKSTIVDK